MSNTPPAERLTVAGIELEHRPEQPSTQKRSYRPETYEGSRDRFSVVLTRLHAPLDASPARWRAFVYFGPGARINGVVHQLFEARVYELEQARDVAERFLEDLMQAAATVAAAVRSNA